MKKITLIFTAAAFLLLAACQGDGDKNSDEQDSTKSGNFTDGGVATPGMGGDSLGSNTVKPGTVNPGSDNASTVRDTFAKPFYISGRLVGGENGNITLDYMEVGKVKPLWTQTINQEGLYDFEGAINMPQLYQLRLPHGRIHLIVCPGDTITVASTLAHPENFTAGGSPETMRLKQMYEILEAANAKKRALREEMQKTTDNQQLARLSELQPIKFQQVENEKYENLKKFIDKIDTSFVAIMAVMYLNPEQDFDFLEKIDKKFTGKWPNSPFYKSLHEKIVIYGPVQLGHKAPEILSTTPENKTLRLSDMKGKYVLVDFWASWCKPCRNENPKVKQAYEKYKGKGFEILSISLDEKKQDWLNAIKEDQMTWKHVSDLNGFKATSAQTYLINAIPTTFLIDPQGKILAKNLRGAELERKLASIFKQ